MINSGGPLAGPTPSTEPKISDKTTSHNIPGATPEELAFLKKYEGVINISPELWVKQWKSGTGSYAQGTNSIIGLYPAFRTALVKAMIGAESQGFIYGRDYWIGSAAASRPAGSSSKHPKGLAVDFHTPAGSGGEAIFKSLGPLLRKAGNVRWGHDYINFKWDVHCGGKNNSQAHQEDDKDEYVVRGLLVSITEEQLKNSGKFAFASFMRDGLSTKSDYKLGDWEHFDWNGPVNNYTFPGTKEEMEKFLGETIDDPATAVDTSSSGSSVSVQVSQAVLSNLITSYLQDFLDYEYLIRRFSERTGTLILPYNPEILPGFGIRVRARYNRLAGLDDDTNSTILLAYVAGMEHSISVDPPQATTTLQLTMIRTEEEDKLLRSTDLVKYAPGGLNQDIYKHLGTSIIPSDNQGNLVKTLSKNRERKHATLADIKRIYLNSGKKQMTTLTKDLFTQYFGALPSITPPAPVENKDPTKTTSTETKAST